MANYAGNEFYDGLIIVSGEHLAKMYELKNGKIIPEPTVQVDRVIYTDAEGFRGRDNRPAVSGTPSGNQKKDTGEWHDFTVRFKNELAQLMQKNQFAKFYLFAPQEVLSKIFDLLPPECQRQLELQHPGNFTKASPHDLEQIIAEHYQNLRPEHWTARAEQAEKILKYPKIDNGQGLE